MKRFWLFAGEDYYPRAGISDFQGAYATAEEAMADLKTEYNGNEVEWAQVIEVAEDGPRLIANWGRGDSRKDPDWIVCKWRMTG